MRTPGERLSRLCGRIFCDGSFVTIYHYYLLLLLCDYHSFATYDHHSEDIMRPSNVFGSANSKYFTFSVEKKTFWATRDLLLIHTRWTFKRLVITSTAIFNLETIKSNLATSTTAPKCFLVQYLSVNGERETMRRRPPFVRTGITVVVSLGLPQPLAIKRNPPRSTANHRDQSQTTAIHHERPQTDLNWSQRIVNNCKHMVKV